MSSKAPSHKAGRDAQNLPAWYRRLVAMTIKEDRDIEPDDFDQDISDLGETSDANANSDGSACASCKWGEYTDACHCNGELSGYDTDDCSSRRSYDGSDADYYYQLKEEREERKQELQEIRLEKLRALDFEQQKVTEVEEAFALMQDTCSSSDATSLIDPLARRNFRLFCVEYVDRFYDAHLSSSKYIEFHALDEESSSHDNLEQIYGHVYFDANTGCDLAPFVPPKLAGLDEYTLKSFHGENKLSVRFISNDYLILIVPQCLMFEDQSPLQSAPDSFKFMGIRYDRDKETKERKAKRKRSPSPRESWFEMNHPMGAWGH